ncbi:DUF2167 domain-containing protein [Hymenobacter arizonensis]|uniref:Uncharacterized membrane-anchored protein n=1 Tax=Hymenobacter arizonensis TaxID=1227077 RepID=A0A1I6AJE9_HYMAR|nr:DUF2167 domain-containing protein [Hymenobacter arizonensis]SFQ68822.1 Uncharacterized membrane-anchored protein [Hymenobacter arizonensis]
MKKHLLLVSLLLASEGAFAGPKPVPTAADSVVMRMAAYKAYTDSVQATLHYQQGHIVLPGGIGELTVPNGFRYLDSAQSRRVLTQLWGNPKSETLGMLFPANRGPLDEKAWAYSISYDAMGYVKDDDADDIDYKELLEEMQGDTEENNKERQAAGYEPFYLLGWAANPYYDKNTHALHWAKSIRFGSNPDTTLNYNVRLLGRKGVLVLNAIGEREQLPEIKASIPGLLAGVSFARGQQYVDFNADIDEVAAYSIGGLVAGKVLAKVGLFAIILKFWKLGLLALAGAWAGVKRFFGFGTKES